MKPKLSKKSNDSSNEISPVQQIMGYASPEYFKSRGLDPSKIISFAGGWVNHASPEPLRQAYKDIIDNPELFHKSGGYSSILGIQECKEALIEYEEYLYNLKGLELSNIALGASSTQLTSNLLSILLDPLDKILLLDPSYCTLPTQIKNNIGAQIIRFSVMDEKNWKYVAEERIGEFVKFIKSEKPKVVLLISPDNPTSQILSDNFVKNTLKAVEEIGSFLVIDFAYKDLTFIDKLPEYYSWPPTENFLSIHSNSKWIRSLGRRLGWLEASKEIVQALDLVQGLSILSPDALHQLTLARYLKKAIRDDSLKVYVEDVRDQYKRAAEHITNEIKKHTNLPFLTPLGGIYTSIKIGQDGENFVESMVKEKNVLFIPGWGFGDTQKEAIRVSYGPLVNNPEMISEGIKRLGEYLRENGLFGKKI